jgi:hypothetical protein
VLEVEVSLRGPETMAVADIADTGFVVGATAASDIVAEDVV